MREHKKLFPFAIDEAGRSAARLGIAMGTILFPFSYNFALQTFELKVSISWAKAFIIKNFRLSILYSCFGLISAGNFCFIPFKPCLPASS